MSENDFEQRLRETMRTQSAHAPDDHAVMQHVLRDVQVRRVSRPARWRTWTVPLIAAGAVAAVAAALVGVQHYRPTAHHHVTPATIGQPTPIAPTVSAPGPSQSVSPTSGSSAPVDKTLGLTHFRVSDLTWVGSNGWALGRANCLSGPGTCIAMAHTTDGTTWRSMRNPPAGLADLGCTATCVAHVRFATATTGYVYGSSAFFMTSNGGKTWLSTPTGLQTLAVETLDSNVIRVETMCLPGCPVTVQTARIGTTQWSDSALPGAQPSMTSGATLIRVAGLSYLDLYDHISGGAQHATSTLFVSADDGATWVNGGEPCPQTGGGLAGNEVDSTNIASGGGSFVVLCTPRSGTTSFTYLSTDRGQTYQRADANIGGTAGLPLAVSGQVILLASDDSLWRTTDGGKNWTGNQNRAMGNILWLGFESVTDGRAVSADGTTIWTTHDAGAQWTGVTFP